MAARRYLDFDLCIERTATGYRAQVVSSPTGEASLAFQLPFSPLELENFLLKVGGRRRIVRGVGSPELEAAREFGGRLFETVFDDEVRGCLHSSVIEAEQQGAGLRLRLRLDDAPELADLPWEYLYNPDRGLFLTLSAKTPLVRYLELPEPTPSLAVSPPLRMLVIVSSPSDYPPLDVEHEWSNLTAALAQLQQRGLLTLERMQRATLPELQRTLRRQPYHMLHFIGHGSFQDQSGDGVLIFEDEQGKGAAVSGSYLGTLLHDYDTLRLAVLNACEGARSSAADPFAGTAQSLIRQGLPAVIAMQFEVSDSAAITFAREFYGAIAEGLPVDAALGEARKAIFAEGIGVEWGTPVLHLRAADGAIFDVAGRSAEAPFALPVAAPPAATPSARTLAATAEPAAPSPTVDDPLRRALGIGKRWLLRGLGVAGVLVVLVLTFGWYVSRGTFECTVRAPGIPLLNGPGPAFPVLRDIAGGTRLTVRGRDAAASWFLLELRDGHRGWGGGPENFVNCSGDIAALAVAPAPSAPVVAASVSVEPKVDASASAAPSSAASASPEASAAAPAGLPLTAALPRSTRYASLIFTVDEAKIVSSPPEGVVAPPPVSGPQSFAVLVVTIFNPLPNATVAIAPRQVKLQLAGGQVVDDLKGWSGSVATDETVAVTYVYPVPAATAWEGTQLLVRVPGKAQAALPLDGPAPELPAPLSLPVGSATADQVTYQILAATSDLDENGERANAGERFLNLRLRVVNNSTREGGLLVSSNNFRLIVDDVPLAPINAPSLGIEPQSAKEVQLVFVMPDDARSAALQVGLITGPTAPIALTLDPTAPTPTPVPPVASCRGDVGASFAPLFRENVRVRVALGCATSAQRDGRAVVQRYEHGGMIWLEESDTIYALLDPEAGTYRVYSAAATAAFAEAPPPERSMDPVRGFGRVYFGAPEVRAALGSSLAAEQEVRVQVQPFQNGVLLALPAQDAEPATIVMGLADGTFTRFPERR